MSQENVDCFLRVIDAFNQRERDVFLALMDSDVEAESRLAAVEGGYHGHDGVIRWWNNLLETFPDYSLEVEEPRDLGDVTITRLRAGGHASRQRHTVDRIWLAARWRDGKCVWWRVCSTEAEALEAVGLSE